MLDRSEVGKRGYLLEEYRLFHLRDSRAEKLDYHYHEFDKVVLQLGGRVTYHVEGKSYLLQPMDLLLVSRNLLHLPEIDPAQPYERMVLWIDRGFLARHSGADWDLAACFDESARRGFHLYRPRGEERNLYRGLFDRLETACADRGFAGRLLADTCALQLLIQLDRDVLAAPPQAEDVSYRFDPKMEEVTGYIRDHLAEELTIDRLAGAFFLSRYYLMHRFKEITGYTVHQYTVQKRLLRAGELIREGVPVMKAAEQAGFPEYSTFLRAFQNTFHTSPKNFR